MFNKFMEEFKQGYKGTQKKIEDPAKQNTPEMKTFWRKIGVLVLILGLLGIIPIIVTATNIGRISKFNLTLVIVFIGGGIYMIVKGKLPGKK